MDFVLSSKINILEFLLTVWRVNFEGGKFRGFRELYSILEILTTKVSNFSTVQFLHQLRHSIYVGIHEIHEPLVKLAHLTLVSRGQTTISAQGVYRLQYILQAINTMRGNSGLATRD